MPGELRRFVRSVQIIRAGDRARNAERQTSRPAAMPGMTGTELARYARRQNPALPILVISGFAELEELALDLPRLMKPFREDELSSALNALKTTTR